MLLSVVIYKEDFSALVYKLYTICTIEVYSDSLGLPIILSCFNHGLLKKSRVE